MSVAAGWLALGVALHLANQLARGRGWHNAVRRAGAAPRRRDTVAAWVAGAGAGGVVSARGGDAVRVALLRRGLEPGAGALLTGTLVAESAGELTVSVALLVMAVALGVGPHVDASWPLVAAVGAALAAALLLVWAVRRRHRAGPHARARWARRAFAVWRGWAARVFAVRRGGWVVRRRGGEPRARRGWATRMRAAAVRAGHGCACLRCPGYYAREVLPWQLLSRAFRLLALACFLTAFGLPATPAAVLLVVFAQGSGRLVPFGPASVGAGAAILAATFTPITGTSVSASRVASFFVGTSTVLTIVGTAVALTICLRTVAWRELAQASANAGRRVAPGLLDLWMRTRAAIAPRP